MSEHPACHEAPFAHREKWSGTEMMNSARSVNMSLSCNVSPTSPPTLHCWVFADIASQETRTLPFISKFLWAQVLYCGNSVSKYNITSNLSGVIPAAAAPASSAEIRRGVKTFYTYFNYSDNFCESNSSYRLRQGIDNQLSVKFESVHWWVNICWGLTDLCFSDAHSDTIVFV